MTGKGWRIDGGSILVAERIERKFPKTDRDLRQLPHPSGGDLQRGGNDYESRYLFSGFKSAS